MNDELIFLGTGGGRHHIRTQYRATGGILYQVKGIQCHLDPGPGAIVRINQFKEDPTKTELFIVTHAHVDHYNDLSAMIEASRESFHDEKYHYYKKGVLLTTKEMIHLTPAYHLDMLEKVIEFKAGDKYTYKGIEIIGTEVHHSKQEGFGVIFKVEDYSIAFTSDTMVFNGFSKQFNGVNIVVLNLLRPDSVTCKRHLCTDEVIPYLNKITPPLDCLIITHFGSLMDGPRSEYNHVPDQVIKLQNQTNIKKIIAAEDGMKLNIKKLLH